MITPVVAFYMLLDWDDMISVIDNLVPPRHRADVRFLAREIDLALAGFVRGQSLVCLFLGVWYAIGLSSIGLNFGFLIGVIAGCLSFIPYVGSITAFTFSIIIAIVQGWPHIHLAVEAVVLVTIGLIMDGYAVAKARWGLGWLASRLDYVRVASLRRFIWFYWSDRRCANGCGDWCRDALFGWALSRKRNLSRT